MAGSSRDRVGFTSSPRTFDRECRSGAPTGGLPRRASIQSGEWAGWTSRTGRYGDIKIKLIEETVAKPARSVWPPGFGSIFCGWTAEGNVFANVEEGRRWGLVILDKQGTVLRRITTDVRPMAGTGASWRNDDGRVP